MTENKIIIPIWKKSNLTVRKRTYRVLCVLFSCSEAGKDKAALL